MRTTVQLPDDLLRAAKAEAAVQGETLKDFLARAVSHELGGSSQPAQQGRMRLPLVSGSGSSGVDVSNAEIEAIFAAEDAERARND